MESKQGLQIELKGEAEIRLPAERAVLKVVIKRETYEKQKSSQSVIESAKKVETLLRSISSSKDDQTPAADHWTRTSLSETSHTPYDHETREHLDKEYTASIDYEVSIQQFARLGPILHNLSALPHVSSKGVTWQLTDTTISQQRSKLRRMAAANALTKAQDYAEALGFERIVAVEAREQSTYTQSSNRKAGRVEKLAEGMGGEAKNMAEADAEAEDWEKVGDEVFQYTPESVVMTLDAWVKFKAE